MGNVERKGGELSKAELERPLEELARIFAHVPIGFCVLDTELRYRYINPALAARNGLTVTDHLNQALADILPELASRIEPHLRQALDTGKTVVASTRSVQSPRAQETAVYFQNTYAPIYDGDDRVIGISCIVADVSEREKSGQKLQSHVNELETQVAARTADLAEMNQRLAAEVADSKSTENVLRQTEQRFQDFAKIAADWFAETDPDHRFTFMSDSISMLGLTPADYIGKNRYSILAAASDPNAPNEELTAIQERRPFRNIERQSSLADGKWLRLSGDPRFDVDGIFLGYRISGTDITELKQKEEALRLSEERFRDFASMSADWFAESDAEHRFTYMSESVSMIGHEAKEFIGKTRQEIHGDDYDAVWRQPDMVAIRNHQPYRNVERRSKVNGDKWIRLNGEPFFDDKAEFLGYRITSADITELKQHEAALRESERRFRDFASVSADWFAETDADLRYTFMSDSISLIGMESREFIGRNRAEILGADFDPEALGDDYAAMLAHQPFRSIERRSNVDRAIWFRMSGEPKFDPAGKFLGYRITGTDISELKQQEEALRTSERRFRDFADNTSDWFWEMDENLRYTWISASFERFTGVPAEWHYGKSLSEIELSGMDTPEWRARLEALERREPFRDVLHQRVTAKGKFWLLSSGVPVFDDDGVFKGYFGTGQDITALRDAEQANERFLEAIERLSEGVAVFDAEDRFVICNAQYRRLTAFRDEYLVPGNTFEEMMRDAIAHGFIPDAADDPEGWLAGRLARRHEDSESFGFRAGEYDLRITDSRLPNGDSVQMLHDVTDLKRSEEQLRQAQKMEAIGQLTGGIAHDFNNLLAVMMGNLAILDDELGPDNELLSLTAPVLRAVDRAAELTSRMLAFARQQPLSAGVVDVNALLDQMQPLLHRSLTVEIDIELVMAEELETCIADAGQLEQAILNLAINARDAMPQGGRLIIETRNAKLPDDLVASGMEIKPGAFVMIAVTDHGDGIPGEDLPRIFDPFFTTKEVGKGTGLVLSMVYGLIKQSDGHVTVDSEAGVGTTFRLYLPVGGE